MASNSGQDKDAVQRAGGRERRRDSARGTGLISRGRGRGLQLTSEAGAVGHGMRRSCDIEYQNETDSSRRGSGGAYRGRGNCGSGKDSRRGRRKSDQGPRYRPSYQSAQKGFTKVSDFIF